MIVAKLFDIKFEPTHETNSHRTELSLLADEIQLAFAGDANAMFLYTQYVIKAGGRPKVRLSQEEVDWLFERAKRNWDKISYKETPVLFDLYMKLKEITTIQ